MPDSEYQMDARFAVDALDVIARNADPDTERAYIALLAAAGQMIDEFELPVDTLAPVFEAFRAAEIAAGGTGETPFAKALKTIHAMEKRGWLTPSG
jgi:hypothetical protein